jgi:drug/metabolite transporter (DMT)-like permease
VAFGMAVAALYAVYILMLRQATSAGGGTATRATADRATADRATADGGGRRAVAAPLFEATLGATAGALVLGLALRDFRLGPAWPDLGWLALLALTSQVVGWLLITTSMPRLPAWLVGALLLVQPAGSVALSAAVLGERPSLPQLAGVTLMLGGVLIAASGHARRPAGDREAVAVTEPGVNRLANSKY